MTEETVSQLNILGLGLNFIGGLLMMEYARRTKGATTDADREFLVAKDRLTSSFWTLAGPGFLTVGFLLRLVTEGAKILGWVVKN